MKHILPMPHVFLSKVVLNAPKEELYKAIVINEKLGGNSWLVDPVQAKYPNCYKKIKKLAGYQGYGRDSKDQST